ncbi:MAG TPA: hypothetical protein VMB47_14005 [Candidatus Aquilonibacter sp.]|nr:hypothetical protein [Candidatus Aquilonibacter sp.]
MFRNTAIAGLCGALAVVLGFAPVRATRAQTASGAGSLSQAPADAELNARGAELIANQHKDDDALDQYERIEHEVDKTGGAYPRTLDDKKVRLVPNGAGTTKLLLEENGETVTPEQYQRELQNWLSVLQFMVNPDDDRMKTATAKYLRKKQTRTELVDAMLTAFTRKWVRREMMDGRDCDVIELTPDPNFHPHSIFEDALPHANATIWVDHNANQLVRAEAKITSDVWVGGGVLGKLYKGGVFVMEQAEVAPGVWLPTKYQFDFSGRKFLFSFEEHERIDVSRYRYMGTAKDAIAVAQSELASGKPLAGDP